MPNVKTPASSPRPVPPAAGRRVSRSVALSLALVVVAVLALVLAVILTRPEAAPPADGEASSAAMLVRPDSPRLTEGSKVQLVEFLDFECEACGALYPLVEELKETYGDRVEVVVRYVPLHTSSVSAALAAEAAGAQGAYEQMYDLLFQRQADWGHQQAPEREKFFEYARELGLDMARFERDFVDPNALARIEQSQRDAQGLGVTGTPTFFLDGERLEINAYGDLEAALKGALDG